MSLVNLFSIAKTALSGVWGSVRLYVYAFFLLLYPAVGLYEHHSGYAAGQLDDAKATVKEDKVVAADNKKAADAAIARAAEESKTLNDLEHQKDDFPKTPGGTGCKLTDEQLKQLQQLTDEANK